MQTSGNYYLLDCFNRSISLVVSPIDCFTGRAVAGEHITVTIEGLEHKRPVIKRDGYYVFSDLPSGTYEIEISSKEYFTERRTANTDGDVVIEIEIIPNRRYKIPNGVTCVTGYFGKDMRLYAMPLTSDSRLRLAAYDEKSVTVYSPYNIDLSNKRFALMPDNVLEIFEVKSKIEKNTYRLKTGIRGKYKRGEAICAVSLGKTDSEGYLFCPIRGFSEDCKEVLIGFESWDEYKRYEIKYGEMNFLRRA